ncbi:MAG: glycosyltransferase family 2 protein, partial [Vicingaceae bacterium]|nr:glycosyltransferase family 2 protein [Vicingaceae bacterium]
MIDNNWYRKPSPIYYDSLIHWPKISIVTPSYNQGEFIEDTILSVINQNYPNLEYVIIDGESTDQTISIIKKYEDKITYWISEKDKGQTDAINKGFKKITGEIFNWLNSDDLLAENALYTIASHFLENKHCSCLCGREFRFFNDKIVNESFGSSIEYSIEETLIKAHIDQPSTYFKTSSIKQVFPLASELKYCMDTQLWLGYILLNGIDEINHIEQKLVYFRYHDNSKTYKSAIFFRKELFMLLDDLYLTLENRKSMFFKRVNLNIDIDYYQDLLIIKKNNEDSLDKLYRNSAAYFNSLKLFKPALLLSF